MTLLVPAALAFGIIIPIILLLYFMRPKRQERVVSSTLLWQQALQDLQASRPWQRLRITPLLLLQLLAALVVVLVLARPATFFSSPITGDTIIILQASASMQATDLTPSRFEAAKSEVADLIAGIGPGDHVSLITMARTPQVLIAESQDKGQLNAALQRAKVTNQDADLEQALSLATALAAGRPNTQILVVGDGHVLAPDQVLALPIPVRYLRVGTDTGNIALIALASRNLDGNLTALAQVANYSHQQRSVPVELYADGKLVNVQNINLAAGASGSLQWGPLPTTTHFLHAKLDAQDPMTVDHDAWAIVGGSMHGKVLLVTKGNSFLEAALRLQPNIGLYETTPAKYLNAGSYDLTIFDGFVPSAMPSGGLFFVNPPTGSYIFGKSGQNISVSHINAGNDSANLLQDVDLSSIHVLHASHQFTPAAWAQAVITTPETSLLIAGETNNRRVAALGFDLHDSDLPLQPSFPILIYNMVNWFMPPPVGGDGQVSPGEPVTISTWPGASSVTITAPGQKAVAVAPPFPATAFAQTDATGIYLVAQRVQGQERDGAFAVNLFDPSQSRLAPANALPIAHSTDFTSGGTAIPRVLREIWPWIAAFFLLVLCAEWWLFSRGYARKSAVSGTGKGIGFLQRRNGQLQSPEHTGMFGGVQDAMEARYKDTRRRVVKTVKRMRRSGIRLR
jgi:Ca-activated chloride channel family protein